MGVVAPFLNSSVPGAEQASMTTELGGGFSAMAGKQLDLSFQNVNNHQASYKIHICMLHLHNYL